MGFQDPLLLKAGQKYCKCSKGSILQYWGPRGFGDLERMAIFSESWGALVIFRGELGHNLGDLGSPAKKQKKGKASFSLFFLISSPLVNSKCRSIYLCTRHAHPD